jgi:hypothetical protein
MGSQKGYARRGLFAVHRLAKATPFLTPNPSQRQAPFRRCLSNTSLPQAKHGPAKSEIYSRNAPATSRINPPTMMNEEQSRPAPASTPPPACADSANAGGPEARLHADLESFVHASDGSARLQASARLLQTVQTLRDQAERAGVQSSRFAQLEHAVRQLDTLAHTADVTARRTALQPLARSLELLQKNIPLLGTPEQPGARWQLAQAPLTSAEQSARIKAAQSKTKGTARSLSDAIRKTIAARQEAGVPLHTTYSREVRAVYAAAAVDHAIGLVPLTPLHPGITPGTAPWGMFKVSSAIAPADAESHFAHSPPLPIHGEVLESRLQKNKFPALHPAPGLPPAASGNQPPP